MSERVPDEDLDPTGPMNRFISGARPTGPLARLPTIVLGPKGEEEFARLRTALEIGQGFELFFSCSPSRRVLDEIRVRLTEGTIPGIAPRLLAYPSPPDLLDLLRDLLSMPPAPDGKRHAVFVAAEGRDEELRANWVRALIPLNEQRNRLIRACPAALVLSGPPWLATLAQERSPDLWSIRSSVFRFPDPPADSRTGLETLPRLSVGDPGAPMAHELEDGDYYAKLAEAFEGSERPGERQSHARLLVRAGEAWALRGELDKAKSALESALAVYCSLGDVREKAVTMGRIADILQQRGETDEALRIRREEELPVYERLGDVREKAVTMGKIADILLQRGETDEALRIRREEQLPVYERLGDVRERALTMGRIADILQQRGETDEALRLWREEVLPAMERLGDVRSKAVTMGRIADILEQRGETDEALRIHIEERLPVAKKMGDLDSIAASRFKCAKIRLSRGGMEKGEAQIIHDELAESFVINLKLQRADGIAFSGLLFGRVLAMRGDRDKALQVLDVAAAVFEKLKMTDNVAQVRALQDQIRQAMNPD